MTIFCLRPKISDTFSNITDVLDVHNCGLYLRVHAFRGLINIEMQLVKSYKLMFFIRLNVVAESLTSRKHNSHNNT